ncbi:MAG: ADP-ribosylglycohydrolase family protein [Rhodanobacteraceae bacterium]|nr:ADP-ribosylglycohydrolase family protein [Rhodanobacteraceae bacterium]
MGLAVGDAAGAFCECKAADDPLITGLDGQTLQPFTLRDGRTFPPGSVTDDTQMSVALSLALVEKHGFDRERVGTEYLRWHKSQPRGQGGTVRQALERLDALRLGKIDAETVPGVPGALGTGTAMRAHPLGIVFIDAYQRDKACFDDALLTHASYEAVLGSQIVAAVTNALIQRAEAKLSDEGRRDDCAKVVDLIPHAGQAMHKAPANTVLALVQQALGCFLNASSYEEAVVAAVRMGGDTDTRASIVGGWAACVWPIPGRWLEVLEDRAMLEGLETGLFYVRGLLNPPPWWKLLRDVLGVVG